MAQKRVTLYFSQLVLVFLVGGGGVSEISVVCRQVSGVGGEGVLTGDPCVPCAQAVVTTHFAPKSNKL